MTNTLNNNERASLRQFLLESFSYEDLIDIAFDLGIDEEVVHEFPREPNRQQIARSLITHIEKKGEMGCLLFEIRRRRPNKDYLIPNLLEKVGPCLPRKKVVVQTRSNVVNIKETKNSLAILFGVKPDEVEIVASVLGSIRLLISIPFRTKNLPASIEISKSNLELGLEIITYFDDLDPLSKQGWRLVANNYSPKRIDGFLEPNIYWSDVIRLTTKAKLIQSLIDLWRLEDYTGHQLQEGPDGSLILGVFLNGQNYRKQAVLRFILSHDEPVLVDIYLKNSNGEIFLVKNPKEYNGIPLSELIINLEKKYGPSTKIIDENNSWI